MNPRLTLVPPAEPERNARVPSAMRGFVNGLCPPVARDPLGLLASKPTRQIGDNNMNEGR